MVEKCADPGVTGLQPRGLLGASRSPGLPAARWYRFAGVDLSSVACWQLRVTLQPMSEMPHLTRAPILESLIHFQANAAESWNPEALKSRFAEVWPEHRDVSEMRQFEVRLQSLSGAVPETNPSPQVDALILRSKQRPSVYQLRRDGFGLLTEKAVERYRWPMLAFVPPPGFNADRSMSCTGLGSVLRCTQAEVSRAIPASDFHGKLISDLYALTSGCSDREWDGYGPAPIRIEAFGSALRFIQAIPSYVPAPELATDPDGYVTFEWHASSYRTLLVSVHPNFRVDFAALIGTTRISGTEAFFDKFPETVLDLVGKILPR
jgi:hypothetical protein